MKSRRPRSAGRVGEDIKGLVGEIAPFTTLESVRACIFKKYGVRMWTSTVGRIKKEINSECVRAVPGAESVVEPSVSERGVISKNDGDGWEDFTRSIVSSEANWVKRVRWVNRVNRIRWIKRVNRVKWVRWIKRVKKNKGL
jgi:hypothetical protein